MFPQLPALIMLLYLPTYFPTDLICQCFASRAQVSPPHYITIYSTLRFTTTRPMPLTIYTADFTIFDNATAIESFPRPTAEIDNINGTQLLLTLVLPSTTIVSQLPPTPNIVASSTVIADPLPSGGGAGGTGLNHVWNGGISARSKKFDMEKFKFRLVYIVWPALVGYVFTDSCQIEMILTSCEGFPWQCSQSKDQNISQTSHAFTSTFIHCITITITLPHYVSNHITICIHSLCTHL